MSPTYPTGSLVVDAPARTRDPAVGQVITFQTPGGLVTHRVNVAWSLFFGAPEPEPLPA